jgi:heme/copper-type cytochrome/quinol oxidase subunit 1
MKHKAHMYFWIISILLLLEGVLERIVSKDTTLDINVHDMYLVIDHLYVNILFALLYFILGVAYWVPYKTNLELQKKYTKVHTVITVMAVPAFYILWACNAIMYTSNSITDKSYDTFNTGLLIIFFIVLLVQPLYPVNIILSLIKRKKA